MSGPALMLDIPRSSGNTFIIYSSSLTSPVVRQAPSFSAVTDIAEVSGSLDNELLSITWRDGWQVRCKKTSVWGQFSFDVTVTSKGSDSRLSDTQRFTLEVVLMAVDESFDYIFRQYQVGEKVSEKLEQTPAGPVLSYGVRGQLYSPDEKRYGSGLFLSLVDETGDGFEVPKITGTAARPGIYVAAIHCASDDISTFSGGTDMLAPVVVAIRDKDYEDGQLMVLADNQVQFNENSLRLVYCDDDLFNNKGGNFCVRMSGGGGTWLGQYEEQAQTTVFVTEYQVQLAGERWQLSRREYTQGDPPPGWTKISSAGKLAGSDLPPSAGWSDGAVISGDTRYFVPGYGLFDYKGVGEFGEFYQQQTTHTRQYKGWDTAAEYTHNSGHILRKKEIDGKLEWVLPGTDEFGNAIDNVVTPQAVSGVVFPYSPAVTEKYGNIAVRDLTFSGLCTHAQLGQFVAASGGFASGFFTVPDVRRQMVPYNGTSGDRKYKFTGVDVKVSKNTFVERGEKYEQTYREGEGYYSRGESDYTLEQGVELEWLLDGMPLDCCRRSGDVFSWLMTTGKPDIDAKHTVEGSGSGRSTWGFYGTPGDPPYIYGRDEHVAEFKNISEETTQSDLPSLLTFYIAGAPDAEKGKQHQLWSLCRWSGGGANSRFTDRETRTVTEYTEGSDSVDTRKYEADLSGFVDFTPNEFSMIPSRLKIGDDLKVEDQAITEEKSTFTAKVNIYHEDYTYDDSSDSWLVTTTILLWYDLEIKLSRTYAQKGGQVIPTDTRATFKRVEKNPGTYPGDIPTVTTEGVIEDADELQAMIDAAKADVASCELPATDTVGDTAMGRWENTGIRTKLEIKTK